MAIPWLIERMREWRERPAIVWNDEPVSYDSLLDMVSFWKAQLGAHGIEPGAIVALEGDYSPKAIALLVALIDHATIAVPVGTAPLLRKEFMDIAEVQATFTFDNADHWQLELRNRVVNNAVSRSLIELGEPGLVIFSSGSTGKPKASLHNMTLFLMKFRVPRATLRTIALPTMDHVAGLDTLFYILSSGGMLIAIPHRTPYSVCQEIERYKAELLPASATFLNLLLISEAHYQFDLSSLRLIAYGSEILAEHTLNRLKAIFPRCKLINKYGTTEMGSPRTRSREDGSLWIKIDCEGFDTKVVDGVLWIRAQSAMMGYLNAPSPFDEEGWLNTDDVVDVDGDYLRILGRRSEIINVGGQKVYPTEVENVLMQMSNIQDATVYGVKNPIMGKIVAADVSLVEAEELSELKKRIRTFCRKRLASYKIPLKIEIVNRDQFTVRYKKVRRAQVEDRRDD
jgi:long-chain acyl-CoA synthetase